MGKTINPGDSSSIPPPEGGVDGSPSPRRAADETRSSRGWYALVALCLGVLVGWLLLFSGEYDATVAVIEVARIALAIIAALAVARVVRRAIQH